MKYCKRCGTPYNEHVHEMIYTLPPKLVEKKCFNCGLSLE